MMTMMSDRVPKPLPRVQVKLSPERAKSPRRPVPKGYLDRMLREGLENQRKNPPKEPVAPEY